MNFDILLKTRTFSKDYSWICLKEYIEDSLIEKVDKFIGNIYNNQEFRTVIKNRGKDIFYVIVNSKNIVLSRFAFSSMLDMAGRNIYSFEGISTSVDNIDEFFKNILDIVFALKNSKNILRDIILNKETNEILNDSFNIEELLKLCGNNDKQNTNEKTCNKNPYKYLYYKLKEMQDNNLLNQEKIFVLLSDDVSIPDEYDFDEMIYLDKIDYDIPNIDEENVDVKSSILDKVVDTSNFMPSEVIRFFDTSFKYKEEIKNNVNLVNEFLGICIFNVYRKENSYEYKIKLVDYYDRSKALFETKSCIYPLYGMSVDDIKNSISKFISLLTKYGFEKELESGLLVKYNNSNLDLNINDTIVLDIDDIEEHINLKKDVYYSIAPLVNISYQYKNFRENIKSNKLYKVYKLKKINNKDNVEKSNNIFKLLFNKKSINRDYIDLKYKSNKWTNIIYKKGLR